MWRRGIRHDKVNHHRPSTDFSCTRFFPVGDGENNITLLLTVTPVLGYRLCWQELKSLRYLSLGARSHPSWFVYYLQLCCLGLWASWLVWKGDSWKSSVRLAQALGGRYHVPDRALDTDMLSDLGPDTCCLCLHFPFCEMLMVVLTSQTAWSCAVAKPSMRQHMTSISCVVQARHWERKRLFRHCGTESIMFLHPSWRASLVGDEWESVVHFAFLCSDTEASCKYDDNQHLSSELSKD